MLSQAVCDRILKPLIVPVENIHTNTGCNQKLLNADPIEVTSNGGLMAVGYHILEVADTHQSVQMV